MADSGGSVKDLLRAKLSEPNRRRIGDVDSALLVESGLNRTEATLALRWWHQQIRVTLARDNPSLITNVESRPLSRSAKALLENMVGQVPIAAQLVRHDPWAVVEILAIVMGVETPSHSIADKSVSAKVIFDFVQAHFDNDHPGPLFKTVRRLFPLSENSRSKNDTFADYVGHVSVILCEFCDVVARGAHRYDPGRAPPIAFFWYQFRRLIVRILNGGRSVSSFNNQELKPSRTVGPDEDTNSWEDTIEQKSPPEPVRQLADLVWEKLYQHAGSTKTVSKRVAGEAMAAGEKDDRDHWVQAAVIRYQGDCNRMGVAPDPGLNPDAIRQSAKRISDKTAEEVAEELPAEVEEWRKTQISKSQEKSIPQE